MLDFPTPPPPLTIMFMIQITFECFTHPSKQSLSILFPGFLHPFSLKLLKSIVIINDKCAFHLQPACVEQSQDYQVHLLLLLCHYYTLSFLIRRLSGFNRAGYIQIPCLNINHSVYWALVIKDLSFQSSLVYNSEMEKH